MEKITFNKVKISELRPLVEIGFGDDSDLLEKYQQLPTEFNETVDRNLTNVQQGSEIFQFDYYKVKLGNEVIGFSVVDREKQLLFSFGINIKFRSRDVLIGWFRKIENILGNPFSCMLWNKNERAINFLIKNGMIVWAKNDTTTLLLKK